MALCNWIKGVSCDKTEFQISKHKRSYKNSYPSIVYVRHKTFYIPLDNEIHHHFDYYYIKYKLCLLSEPSPSFYRKTMITYSKLT